jgi:hypothetical protein
VFKHAVHQKSTHYMLKSLAEVEPRMRGMLTDRAAEVIEGL